MTSDPHLPQEGEPQATQPQGLPAPAGSSAGSEPPPARVLIVRTGAIGDVVNALTLAAALKDARAPARPVTIGWLVHPLSAPLLEGGGLVDHVFRVPRGQGLLGLGGYRAALGAAREHAWDLAIDLQRIAKSALLARLSGAPRVLGWDRVRAKEGAWLLVRERVARTDPHKHMVEQYADFARHLGLAPREPFGLLAREPGAAARWAAHPWQGPVAVVNVGASTPQKRWAPERFGAVAAALAAAGLHVVLTGNGADDRAAAGTALATAHAAGAPHVESLVDHTTLPELTELLARAELFVGCDTGPMHMAVSLGCRTLALFGTGRARRTGPYGARAEGPIRVVYAGAAATSPDAPFDGVPAPLTELTSDRVIAHALALLDLPRPAPIP